MTFPCTSCGLCCRHISEIAELRDFDQGDGVCKHLRDNVCTIYETRPEICRVDAMYDKVYKHQMSQQEFYSANAKVCRELQEAYGLPVDQ